MREEEKRLADLQEWELKNQLRTFYNKFGVKEYWITCNQIVYEENKKYWESKPIEFELRCPAIASISTKEKLNHHERLALMFCFLKMGKEGENRLWEILKKQKNFNEQICKENIGGYKKKGLMRGISCEKLMDWGICNIDCSDCPKYKKIMKEKEKKDDKPI